MEDRVRCRAVRAIEPHGRHAGPARAQHVVLEVIADVQRMPGRHVGGPQRGLEMPGGGLAGAERLGAEREAEMAPERQAEHVGVAVGQRAEHVVAREPLEHGVDAGIGLDVVSSFHEHRECLGGESPRRCLVVACREEREAHGLDAQFADAVLQLGAFAMQSPAQVHQGRAVEALRHARAMNAHPLLDPLLGAR